MRILLIGVVAFSVIICTNALASPPVNLPIYDKGLNTYYLQASILGFGNTELLVDTGSGYNAITQYTLDQLVQNHRANFVKKISAKLADGSSKIIDIYNIKEITLGKSCVLRNIEAAVLNNGARNILGLNALKRLAPFAISLEPAQLTLNNCERPVAKTLSITLAD